MRTHRRSLPTVKRLRSLSLLLALTMLMSLLGPLAPPAPVAAQTEGPVRVALLYTTDAAAAQSFVDLLNANGYSAQAVRVGTPGDRRFKVRLPLVAVGSGAAQTAALTAIPDFRQYDLIVIGSDTGADGTWQPEPGLLEAVQASGLPVVGIGAGGHAFFGRLGLEIGYPNGQRTQSAVVQVADFGDSQRFYTTPRPISIPGNGQLRLYQSEQPAIAIPLAERLPDGVRLASLAGAASPFPIVQVQSRYLLWGFNAAPAAMTATGRDLFINAMSFQSQGLELALRSRTFTPPAGVDPDFLQALGSTTLPNLHGFVQLYRQPSERERAVLSDLGVTLDRFVGDTLYTASVTAPRPRLEDPAFAALVRWLGQVLPQDRVDPKVLAGNFEPWAKDTANTVKLLVTFFADVSAGEARTILARYGNASPFANQTWALVMPADRIAALSQEDRISWIEEGPAPLRLLNDVARNDLDVDAVQNVNTGVNPAFYAGMDGTGVVVGVFDSGVEAAGFDHNDFAGRLLRTQNDDNGHGTHVAGIIGASGVNSQTNCPYASCTPFQLRGMAPNVRLAPYGGWDAGVMNEAVNTHGMEVSNHSYVMTCGSYDSTAQTVDRLARGELTDGTTAIPRHTIVWAAANQGIAAQYCTTATLPSGDADPTSGPRGYYSILSPAKNSLTVGSLNPGTQNLRQTSSRGPTWDGRLKPDVAATGCMMSTDHDSQGYVSKCGTSMAAPAVSGIAALMTEQFHQTYPSAGRPYNSTIKALLIQTATDLVHEPAQPGFVEYGWNDPDSGQPVIFHAGPDWSTGYGRVNARRAVAAIRARNFVEGTVSPADPTDTYTVQVTPGRAELKFTLVWDDEPGNPMLGIQAAQLVNDLDLTLQAPDGTIWRPWVLPALPRNNSTFNASNQDTGLADPIVRATHVLPATRGVDRLNNVEQVQVPNPAPGVWTITVTRFALPNGNAQRYSLAGDFRQLNIVSPQTGNVAEAGDPVNPNVVLVVLEANASSGGASSLADATAADFQVQVGGTAAAVISGLPVGDRFFLNVRPQAGVYSAGSKYDLTVTWNGYGADTETRAILFTEREVTDRAIVVDHSGSMSEYDKMAAAKNAARLFIDQSLPADRIAVVGFSTNASTPYPITLVSDSPLTPELNAAKAAVDAFTPGGMTAIGKGLLAGQAQVTAAPADYSVADRIVLLTDGMENVDPLYDTAAVRGVIEPTNTIIDGIAVGPASAGFHALVQTIAGENGGDFFAVTEEGVAKALEDTATAAGSGNASWPQTLPNRLGDIYKTIAEDMLGESRLLQEHGRTDGSAPRAWRLEVPEGLKRLTLAVNWSLYNNRLRLIVTDPNGVVYRYDPQRPDTNRFCRTDPTHETCIIPDPAPGVWRVALEYLDTRKDNEFVLWASAKTEVSFQLLVGTPARELATGAPVHLIGFLSQAGRPLPDQLVTVNIFGPGGGEPVSLPLLDDGQHGDGKKDDGIYANFFWQGFAAGPYAVRGAAVGQDRLGRPFTLFKNVSFHLRPRALYVHADDVQTALRYKALIDDNGMVIDLAHVNSVPSLDLQRYRLVVVGPDTGSLNRWGTEEALRHILRYKRPVLGLGEGGYAFFGRLGLDIGYANGAHSSGVAIRPGNQTDAIWRYPYEFDLRDVRRMTLYERSSPRVDIFLGNQPTGVLVFGRQDNDDRYANLIMENGQWMLWGFQDGPATMTAEGQRLLVNTVYRTMQ